MAVVNGKDAKSYLASQPTTPFCREPVDYSYPDGLISPLIYGLQGLMAAKRGTLLDLTSNNALHYGIPGHVLQHPEHDDSQDFAKRNGSR